MAEPLCPSLRFWRISCIALGRDRIILHLEPRRRRVKCPACGTPSCRVHSRYHRRAWDLPWSRWPVQVSIEARRFFCDQAQCSRRIFTEPFPRVLGRYARRMRRAQAVLLELAHASSAEGAARVARLLGFIVSPDTLIRWQRQERFAFPVPLVLGVDEFALRRGRTYGTLLVDLIRRVPIDLLETKSAPSLAAWLRQHPEVVVLARDRADAYALAGRVAVPTALQVADRFHLVRNVSDALYALLRSRRWVRPDVDEHPTGPHVVPSPLDAVHVGPREGRSTPLKEAHWRAVQEWAKQGLSNRAIAAQVGIDRRTVRRYLELASPPVYPRRRGRPRKIGPYLEYLSRRWSQGCRNAPQLYRELVQLGYQGSESMLRTVVHPWRLLTCLPPRGRSPPLRRLVLPPSARLTEEERSLLKRILEANPLLALGHRLKETFLQIVREKDVAGLELWLQQAEGSGLAAFRAVAKGLRQDWEAVTAALATPWSTAQCEGQICRLKLIKRLAYGRAKPDLLRQRVLHRPLLAG